MATVYSDNHKTGDWTYTRVKVDYDYSTEKATATLLYNRTNNWANTATEVYELTFTFGGKSVYNLHPAFWGYTEDGTVGSVSFSFSKAGGTYSGSASSPHNGYFAFSGSVKIPAKTYSISYSLNGGNSGTTSAQTKSHGTNLTLHGAASRNSTTGSGHVVTFNANGGNNPSKSSATATNTYSYTFNGWKSSATGSTWSAGDTKFSENNDTTLSAQWKTITSKGSITTATCSKNNGTATRTATFNASTNGGSCSTSSLKSTATITYSMNGWYTASSGGTKRAGNGGSYAPDSNETLYAQWGSSTGSYSQITLPNATKSSTTATRTVSFNATNNGGACSTSSLNSTATVTYPLNGWYSASSGGSRYGGSGDKWTPDTSRTLYAQFGSSTGTYSQVTLPTATKNNGTATRKITFNGNGGSTPSAINSNATITYTQTGWYTSTTGGTKRGAAGDKYTPSASETVYAQFSSSTGAYASVDLPTPTRTDYVFKGWSTDPEATSGITGSYIPDDNVTLYATWVEDQAKASVKLNGQWVKGKVFIKKNGTWVKVKKIYRKIDGQWKIGRNS